MPTEERFVTFSLDEVHKALSIFLIQKELPALSSANLESFDLKENGGGDNIYLKLEDASGETSDIDFERKFFAEALVFYCQGSGIPLPKSGTKILHIMEDKIMMKITLG